MMDKTIEKMKELGTYDTSKELIKMMVDILDCVDEGLASNCVSIVLTQKEEPELMKVFMEEIIELGLKEIANIIMDDVQDEIDEEESTDFYSEFDKLLSCLKGDK